MAVAEPIARKPFHVRAARGAPTGLAAVSKCATPATEFEPMSVSP